MLISGHKTRSVFERYNIVDERDVIEAMNRLNTYTSARADAEKAARNPQTRTEGNGTQPADQVEAIFEVGTL